MQVEARQHPGEAAARLVHRQQLGEVVDHGLVLDVGVVQRDLRPCVAQHAGTDGVSFGVVGVEQRLG